MLTALIVCKNEADKFLQSSLMWNSQFVDRLCLYDDQSTDDSVAIAKSVGADVVVRPDSIPSFMEHEGQFREAAWNAFDITDWVIVVDADQFIVTANKPYVPSTDRAAAIRVREMWSESEERVDGNWGNIYQPCLMPWTSSTFKNRPMGCGSLPKGFLNIGNRLSDIFLVHYGYSTKEYAKEKYDRYISLKDHGHAKKHINSIVATPKLQKVSFICPDVWLGVK